MLHSAMVDSPHPDYTAHQAEWLRACDVLAGEDAVKAASEKYLPRLDSQSDDEYAAYKARASFFGATARTLEEYLDLIFRRAPVLSLQDAPAPLQAFAANCDLWGADFSRYARATLRQVLAVGRAGSLVLWDPAASRPVVSSWHAEQILNWTTDRLDGRSTLTSLTLREGQTIRVLRLADGVCLQELWQKAESDWSLTERTTLKRGDTPLPFIPFVFHGPRHSRPEPDKLPLADIIAANLDHYRLDADYKHGLHFAALPTAWVTGFEKSSPLRIGSTTAWVSEIPGAEAGFLEFSGAGLAHIERALEKIERRMALLGARMLEHPSADPDAPAGHSQVMCGLGQLVASLNQSLSRVLQLAEWWSTDAAHPDRCPPARFHINTDLSTGMMRGEDITAVVNAWKSGAISRDTMLDLLKRGEILPDGRTVAQERALIHRSTTPTVG